MLIFVRARAEIDEVLGSKNEVTFEDLTKLEYVNCVFKESLRKWPTVGEFSRVASKDMNFDGTFIPKGSWIEVSLFYSYFDSLIHKICIINYTIHII